MLISKICVSISLSSCLHSVSLLSVCVFVMPECLGMLYAIRCTEGSFDSSGDRRSYECSVCI